jgi:hypothetical protein
MGAASNGAVLTLADISQMFNDVRDQLAAQNGSSLQSRTALTNIQQMLADMRDQLAAQNGSSLQSRTALTNIQQMLADMRDQLAAQRASSSPSSTTLSNIQQMLADMRNQIQFRADPARFFGASTAMDSGFIMYQALAPIVLEKADHLWNAYDMLTVYGISKGWISPADAPFIAESYRLLMSIPNPFNSSPCGGRSTCSYQITQTPGGIRATFYDQPPAPIIPFPAMRSAVASDTDNLNTARGGVEFDIKPKPAGPLQDDLRSKILSSRPSNSAGAWETK